MGETWDQFDVPTYNPTGCNCEHNEVYSWPSGVKVYMDGEDITQFAFGVESLTPDNFTAAFNDVDLSVYAKGAGRHTLSMTAETVGGVNARIEVK
jgi:hypothetical protein